MTYDHRGDTTTEATDATVLPQQDAVQPGCRSLCAQSAVQQPFSVGGQPRATLVQKHEAKPGPASGRDIPFVSAMVPLGFPFSVPRTACIH